MNKISIQAMALIPPTTTNLDPIYQMIKSAGIDCVDFNFDDYLGCNDVRAGIINDVFERPIDQIWADFEPHLQAAKKAGITFEQMHAPFPMKQLGKDALNARMFEITKKSMDICSRMGGKYIVVHPETLPITCTKEQELEHNLSMYKSLIPAAKEYGVVICLENMFDDYNGHLVEGICSDFAESAAMIDELNACAGEEIFGYCFDTGHANILGKNMYRSLVTLGSRLKILHIHDNDGISDLHTMPYTFARSWAQKSTDWDGFLQGLKDIHYTGVLNFEAFRCMREFPRELHPALLRLFADMGHYFAERIQ